MSCSSLGVSLGVSGLIISMGEEEEGFLSVGLETKDDMDIVDCRDRVLETSSTIPDSSEEDLGLVITSLLG